MNISIGFSGAAGAGVNTAGLLLGQMLAGKGCNILADKEYASIIKGDNNCFFLYISDKDTPHISKKIDLFLAFDDLAIQKNQPIYDLQNIVNVKTAAKKYKNVFALGVAVRALGVPQDEGFELINKTFPAETLDANKEDFNAGYAYFDTLSFEHPLLPPSCAMTVGSEKTLMFGNELLAKGAITSGLGFYSAYPMTPASSIIDVIVEYPEKVTFFQGEDEIAVGMAMLGAKYAGKRAMCGTSGGGFALMSEGISFSNQSEIGGVYVLSQRDGPSTGTPTFTAQGDLFYAMNATFGDTKPIVFAPSTFEEMYSTIGKALNRSDKYQHPVIFLVDKQLSECYKTIANDDLHAEQIDHGEVAQSTGQDDYLRYKLTENGISPYAIPGQENMCFMCSSYEHTESGETNEEPTTKGQQIEKRMKKLDTFVQQEFTDSFYGYEIINPNAKNFFVTRGMNRYSIEYALQDKSDRGMIVVKSFQPFDTRLKEFFYAHKEQIQKLVFAEMNYSGQMQQIVMNECNLLGEERATKIQHTRKYTLYPFFHEEIATFCDK